MIDALGIGALADADAYGDAGTNTLVHLAQAVGGLHLPTLASLGLGNITAIPGVAPAERPVIYGRLGALGPGKDSVAGHWELMGIVLDEPLPVFPNGFPDALVARLEAATGHRFICNRPANGISAITDFGAEHLDSGKPILYTSQDSVLQVAAHVDRVPPQELYALCAQARAVLTGQWGLGRVIARPFSGRPGSFERTQGRRDWALAPPGDSYLLALQRAGVPVHGVGKIRDLFAGVGIDVAHAGSTNAAALQATHELAATLEAGFVFTNLIETDQVYGHRKDIAGFAAALSAIDDSLAGLLAQLRPEDLLVITADHGVDPSHPGSDHTREHTPLLASTAAMLGTGGGRRHEGPLSDVGASVLMHLAGERADTLPGSSFLEAS